MVGVSAALIILGIILLSMHATYERVTGKNLFKDLWHDFKWLIGKVE